MTEPTPVSALHLRDRLRATLSEFNVGDPELAVEAVCTQFSGWLRAMAEDWDDTSAVSDVTADAAALFVRGLATGIEEGAPGVSE